MVPTDNIFNIYYDIGRALPFEVQRFPKDATDWYKNQSVLVTEIHPRGKYGEAFGFYLQKGERADSYWCKKDETEPQLIPCCGCGGWSLVRVIGEPTVEANVRDFLVNWQALMRVHREMRNQAAADNLTETSE